LLVPGLTEVRDTSYKYGEALFQLSSRQRPRRYNDEGLHQKPMQPRLADAADIEHVGIVISSLVAHPRHGGQRDTLACGDDGAIDLDVLGCNRETDATARLERIASSTAAGISPGSRHTAIHCSGAAREELPASRCDAGRIGAANDELDDLENDLNRRHLGVGVGRCHES